MRTRWFMPNGSGSDRDTFVQLVMSRQTATTRDVVIEAIEVQ